MPQINKKLIPVEHRKYLRLDTVFPVQFRLEEPAGEVFLSAWLQGFTNNISRDGICLAINNLKPQLIELLKAKKIKLSLEIDLPISRKPVCARSSIIWVKEIVGDQHQYLVGIKYDHISAKQNSNLMRYGWSKKLFIPVILTLVVILAAGLGIHSYLNFKLIQGNKMLIEKLATVLKDSSLTKQNRRGGCPAEELCIRIKNSPGAD